ncbi:MAG: DNA alkylation repair protein [Tannerellaceae bacterium]|nr:DNA alkylation repair protein [Tannerellaceae bacterium]MCD8263716.1 DNA alkylation repair protein [Tannerellaceae bacterium]
MYQDTLKSIRIQLRRYMDGIVSTSMRRQGMDYKMNFGVSLQNIRAIAGSYTKDAGLAQLLWKEEVREMKILATLLYPQEEFTAALARQWVEEIPFQEIAEQLAGNLLQFLPDAPQLAREWIRSEKEYVSVAGFIVYTRLFSKGYLLPVTGEPYFLQVAHSILDKGISRPQRAALTALKRFGRQSGRQAVLVLDAFTDYETAGSAEKEEFYNDMKFEFEYYM